MEDFEELRKLASGNDTDKLERLVLENPGVFHSSDKYGNTVLHYAAGGGHANLVDFLLKQGQTRVDATNRDGWTPFHRAVMEGHADVVNVFLLHKNFDVEAKNVDGSNALHLATIHGRIDVCKRLLEATKLDCNEQDRYGQTALHCAVHYKRLYIARELMSQSGINVNIRDNKGESAFSILARFGTPEMCDIFMDDVRVDVRAAPDGRGTPLHIAALFGNINFMRKVVKLGDVDVYAVDFWGRTALDLALSAEADEVIRFMEQIYVKDGNYKLFLKICIKSGHPARARRCMALHCLDTWESAAMVLRRGKQKYGMKQQDNIRDKLNSGFDPQGKTLILYDLTYQVVEVETRRSTASWKTLYLTARFSWIDSRLGSTGLRKSII